VFWLLSKENALMTLGITHLPKHSSFGLYWISNRYQSNKRKKKCRNFVKKLDYETAKSFLKSGKISCGMEVFFIWSAASLKLSKSFLNQMMNSLFVP
jgi:mannose-1-phosphate guanylyltransferase